MNSTFKWDDKELVNGLDALLDDVEAELNGSSKRLDDEGKNAWRNAIGSKSVLSKGKNGREWFSFNKRQWYITNQWEVPNLVWAGRNFVKTKRKQASANMQKIVGKKKQEELDRALEVAFSKF
jgi:hypothetical protein